MTTDVHRPRRHNEFMLKIAVIAAVLTICSLDAGGARAETFRAATDEFAPVFRVEISGPTRLLTFYEPRHCVIPNYGGRTRESNCQLADV
jgi:hypothetical protein